MAVNLHALRAALTVFSGLLLLCAAPYARAEVVADAALAPLDLTVTSAGGGSAPRDWFRGSATRMEQFWDSAWRKLRTETPDWLQRLSGSSPDSESLAAGGTYLALQEDRHDGTELLTVRHEFDGRGALHAYAGAGISRAEYFEDGDGAVPRVLSKRTREDSMDVAAELGAQLHVGERMHLTADLRWADLDERARILRAEHGPVGADPVQLGLAVGYRFR